MLKCFDYKCVKCQKIFEELVDTKEFPKCKYCGHEETIRLFPRPLHVKINGTPYVHQPTRDE